MESVNRSPRAPRGTPAYWTKWCNWQEGVIAQVKTELLQPSGDPTYRPQYLRQLSRHHLELMLRLYSAGASVSAMAPWFEGLLAAWEDSQQLEPTVYAPEVVHSRRTWAVNFDLYAECAWLIGLGLALDIPEGQWQRLLVLMGNEGEDALLDRMIATRTPQRRIGTQLLYPKPYGRLHAAITAPEAERPQLLRDFVAHWYAELDRPASPGRPAVYNRPYWHRLGDQNFEGGAYFGRWCLEAAAAAKAFGIDDHLCLGHEHYPADLIRPDAPVAARQPEPARRPWWRLW